MNEDNLDSKKSILQVVPEANERKLKKVPFVELADGRLQGVVSSGSDLDRVYVSYIKSGSHDFYCSTNNNRKCGGLYGSPCKHITSLLSEAILQYGSKRVIQYLNVPMDSDVECKERDILSNISGSLKEEPASTVFSRFMGHLQFLELDNSVEPLHEMDWFLTKSKDV
ncbi:hypothetical protein FUAX_54320 (plasmid) [Fulvitalea axinellae]|uniref:SWIM-type domain-containing protein n=1 Tax=Fulvitalea axinellae TaxID=1182444 RepID=A0AAU9DP49_9BACT|nr:hypothetical protein FUAX_54320 [Fulvitalea axinellae]